MTTYSGSLFTMTLVRLPDPESARPLAGGAAGAGRMLDFVPILGRLHADT